MKLLQRKLNIITLMHSDLVSPESIEGLGEKDIQPWKMEFRCFYICKLLSCH